MPLADEEKLTGCILCSSYPACCLWIAFINFMMFVFVCGRVVLSLEWNLAKVVFRIQMELYHGINVMSLYIMGRFIGVKLLLHPHSIQLALRTAAARA